MKQLRLNEREVKSSVRRSVCPCPAPGSRGVLKLTLVVILYSDMFTLTLARPMETGPIVLLERVRASWRLHRS
jgi:hypothetical protein